jgi:hypothetical protein
VYNNEITARAILLSNEAQCTTLKKEWRKLDFPGFYQKWLFLREWTPLQWTHFLFSQNHWFLAQKPFDLAIPKYFFSYIKDKALPILPLKNFSFWAKIPWICPNVLVFK